MKKIRLTALHEVAIVLRKKTQKGSTYEAYKAVKGRYDSKENSFFAEDGTVYQHLLEYDPTNKDEFIIGRMPLTTTGNNKNLEEKFFEFYLNNHKNYEYRFRQGNVICINKETKKQYLYEDEEVKLKSIIEDVLKELTASIVEQLINNNENELYQHEAIASISQSAEKTKHKDNQTIIELKQTPKEMVRDITESVKGQDEAVATVITQIYQKYKFKNGKKNNLMLIGPTGVGKTYLFEIISKLYNIPLIVFSVPGLTQAGYVGKSVDEILEQLIASCNGDIEKAQNGMVILDEIDKIAFKSSSQNGMVGTEYVQNELLKMLEGDKRLIKINKEKEVEFDTSNITFIGSGAFQELFTQKQKTMGFGSNSIENSTEKEIINSDSFVKFGLKRELVGRMPIIIELNKLSEETLYNIIYSKNSEMKKMEKLLLECGIRILNIEDVARKMAHASIEKNIGARGLNSTIHKMFSKVLYDVFNNIGEYDCLKLGENILDNNTDYELSRSELLTTKTVKTKTHTK